MVTSKVVIIATWDHPTVKLGVVVIGARHGIVGPLLLLLRHQHLRHLRAGILLQQLATGIVLEVRAAVLSFLPVWVRMNLYTVILMPCLSLPQTIHSGRRIMEQLPSLKRLEEVIGCLPVAVNAGKWLGILPILLPLQHWS
jgi:hypothetical protein